MQQVINALLCGLAACFLSGQAFFFIFRDVYFVVQHVLSSGFFLLKSRLLLTAQALPFCKVDVCILYVKLSATVENINAQRLQVWPGGSSWQKALWKNRGAYGVQTVRCQKLETEADCSGAGSRYLCKAGTCTQRTNEVTAFKAVCSHFVQETENTRTSSRSLGELVVRKRAGNSVLCPQCSVLHQQPRLSCSHCFWPRKHSENDCSGDTSWQGGSFQSLGGGRDAELIPRLHITSQMCWVSFGWYPTQGSHFTSRPVSTSEQRLLLVLQEALCLLCGRGRNELGAINPGVINLCKQQSSEQCIWLASNHHSLYLVSLPVKWWESFLIEMWKRSKWNSGFSFKKPDA